MKKFLSTAKRGFIDPISLITLGILLVGLVVTTSIVKNPDISLDIRQWAKVCPDECTVDTDCGDPTTNQCYKPAGGCPVCRAKRTPPPASCNTGNCYNDCVCHGGLPSDCAQDCNPPAPPPEPPAPEPEPPLPPAPPAPPSCGAEWEECCGSYPNGSCDSGLYCSNLDGGTCRTRVCHAERRCEGNVLKICKADGSGWNNTTCPYGCTNNACQAAPSPSPSPAPPSCGAEWEECCGQGYPNGSCDSGLYCSNIDGGTCRTKVCTAGQKQCSGNSLGYCKADGSGWNYTSCTPYGCSGNQCQTCQPGNVTCSGDTLKTCNSSGTGWNSQTCPANKTCDASLKICVSKTGTCLDPCTIDTDCGEGNYCYQPAGGCTVCKTKGTYCTPGAKQCSGNYAQTCNSYGTAWLSQDCGSSGCDSVAKACKPDPSIISQADCDKCLQTNSPSECSGACKNIGGTITTPTGQKECDPNQNKPYCSGNSLKTCSSSGTWGLTTCSNGCENSACKVPKKGVGDTCSGNDECQSGYCYAAAESPATTAGLNPGGFNLPSLTNTQTRCHQASFQEFQSIGNAAIAGNLVGTGIAAAALGGAAVIPPILTTAGTTVTATGLTGALLTATNIPNAIYSNITAALSSAPAWVQTAGAVATLAQGPLAVIACQIYGADSLPCQYAAMGITAGYYSDVIGSEQILQASGQTINTNVIRPLVDKTIDSVFETVWGPKLNNAYPHNFTENLTDTSYQRLLEEGKTVIPGTDIPLSSVTFDETGYYQFTETTTYNPYQQLLEQTQASVNAGKTPEQAVAQLMENKLGSQTEKGNLLESLNFNIEAQESLAGKVWCGTANCVQQSMVAKQLLNDLGVAETQTIYGLGGAFPFIHSATLTPEGVIMFGGRMTSPEAFTRFTNMIQVMGNFQLP